MYVCMCLTSCSGARIDGADEFDWNSSPRRRGTCCLGMCVCVCEEDVYVCVCQEGCMCVCVCVKGDVCV